MTYFSIYVYKFTPLLLFQFLKGRMKVSATLRWPCTVARSRHVKRGSLESPETLASLWQDVGRHVDMDISLVPDLQVLKHVENKQAPNEIKQHFRATVTVSPD